MPQTIRPTLLTPNSDHKDSPHNMLARVCVDLGQRVVRNGTVITRTSGLNCPSPAKIVQGLRPKVPLACEADW
eukprot:5252776-Heterocapsa_arctica.AAC.1